MKTSSNNLRLIFLGLLSAILIKFIPELFSPEEFARIFYPIGGLVHEAIGAVIVSMVLLLSFIFLKNTRFINLFKISIVTSILIGIYDSLRYLYYLGLAHTLNQDVFKIEALVSRIPGNLIFIYLHLIFQITYYLFLLCLPFASIAIIRNLFYRKQIILIKPPTKILSLFLGTTILLLIVASVNLFNSDKRSFNVKPRLNSFSGNYTLTIIPTKNCSQLSMEECVKSLDCDPEYTGPSCPACLDIGKYKDCKQSSDKIARKDTCERTGGYWNANETHHCQCPESKGKYNRGSDGNLGCLTNEELCIQTSGIYKESCLCPTGFHWEWNFGCYKSD